MVWSEAESSALMRQCDNPMRKPTPVFHDTYFPSWGCHVTIVDTKGCPVKGACKRSRQQNKIHDAAVSPWSAVSFGPYSNKTQGAPHGPDTTRHIHPATYLIGPATPGRHPEPGSDGGRELPKKFPSSHRVSASASASLSQHTPNLFDQPPHITMDG